MVMALIIDPRTGEPFQLDAGKLKDQQTAHVTTVHSEFANHPSSGLTPPKIAQILKSAEQGDIRDQCDLFEDMEEKDGHILTEMAKRKRALLALPWSIEAPSDASAQEQRWADEIDNYISEIEIEDIIVDMGDAIGKAFSTIELDWMENQGKTLPMKYEFIKQRNFKVKHDQIRLRDNSNEGQELWPLGWITHIHKARSGYLDRAALFRTLVWPYLFKNYSVRDLAEFLEIYGLPLRLGTYPRGATSKEKSTLKAAVSAIGHAAAGIVPEGMMIEFKEAAKGNKDPFEYMTEWCERTQSKCILGQTLTAQADGKTSTNALGNVHLEVMRDITVSDVKQIQRTMTRDLITAIGIVNIPGFNPQRGPKFVFDTHECEDMETFGKALNALVDLDMDVPEEWARKKLGIPEAQDGEKVLSKTQPQPPAALKRQHTAVCNHQHEQDAIDDYSDRLDNEAMAAMNGLMKPVQKLVMEANSLEEIRDGLIDLYPDYNVAKLGAVLQQAFAAAELAGRFEAQENI